MTQSMDDKGLKAQVENRLADLFSDEEGSLETMEEGRSMDDHPFKELKVLLLSIEWEITDDAMDSLIREIKGRETAYHDDRIILTFLQLLGSAAKYIKVNKSKAHPKATRVISLVYTALEKVALSEGMAQAEKEKILLDEVARFKRLREEVKVRKEEIKAQVSSKTRGVSVRQEREAVVTPPEETPAASEPEKIRVQPDLGRIPPHEAFAHALEEIKEVIRAEFKALRAEIRLWRESG
ncbi:MAG: hypothetical protein KKE57_08225 [Proteobacteria bacterium]|nr:hypothetical protein [Pseudomonadota bacterium]